MSSNTTSPAELSDAKKQLLARWRKGGPPAATDSIRPRPAGTRANISVDQYRIWLHHSTQADQPTYNETLSLEYRGEMDRMILQKSFDFFLGLHESWRTSFPQEGSSVFQVIEPSVDSTIAYVDLSELPAERREEEDLRVATQQAKRLFDLSAGPLFRLMLVRMAPQEHRLHLVIHHILFDGTSGRSLFVPQLAAIYASMMRGDTPSFQPGELQYADYSLWREQEVAA